MELNSLLSKILIKIKNGSIFMVPYNRLIKKPFFLSERESVNKSKKALVKHLKKVVKNVPFYSNLVRRKGIIINDSSDILDFPIVDRHFITSNFQDFISKKKHRYVYSDAYTGGSTGEPFHFITSGGYEDEFDLKRWKYLGYRKGDKVLSLCGNKVSEANRDNNIYWEKIHDTEVPFGSFGLSSLYLNDNNYSYYIEFLNEFSPSFFWGYVSSIYQIATYIETHNLKLNFKLKAIVMTSETAFDFQIEKIERVFNTKVCLQYGHSEKCINAYTFDDSFIYRVEPLYGYVEILDKDNQPVKEGEIGEVVVTSLHNEVMPLIRYRTGDLAEYGGQDSRYIYINKVYGRTQDYIFDRDGCKVLLTALIFAQHFNALGHITKWQIEQEKEGIVTLHIVKGLKWNKEDEEELVELFDKEGKVDVIFNYVDDLEPTPRGKSKMLIQHIL